MLSQREFEPVPLLMKRVVLHGIPDFSNGTCIPQFTLRHGPQTVRIFKSDWYEVGQETGRETGLGDWTRDWVERLGAGSETGWAGALGVAG